MGRGQMWVFNRWLDCPVEEVQEGRRMDAESSQEAPQSPEGGTGGFAWGLEFGDRKGRFSAFQSHPPCSSPLIFEMETDPNRGRKGKSSHVKACFLLTIQAVLKPLGGQQWTKSNIRWHSQGRDPSGCIPPTSTFSTSTALLSHIFMVRECYVDFAIFLCFFYSAFPSFSPLLWYGLMIWYQCYSTFLTKIILRNESWKCAQKNIFCPEGCSSSVAQVGDTDLFSTYCSRHCPKCFVGIVS